MIKPESEDLIFAKRELIQNLFRIIDREYDDLLEEIKGVQDISAHVEDYLFEYIYNERDLDRTFSEYLDAWRVTN